MHEFLGGTDVTFTTLALRQARAAGLFRRRLSSYKQRRGAEPPPQPLPRDLEVKRPMDAALARRKMVENQLRTNRVTDEALVQAFATIPRERFVPPQKAGYAYVDEDLEVAHRRFLLEPMVLGRLIQALGIGPGDMVLDVACATGYSTAVLGAIAGTVVAVEEDTELAQKANESLNALSVDNAVVVHQPHAEGYSKQAPYDAILINGALPEVPQALFEQLADGGRLAAVIKSVSGMGRATLFSKQGGLVGHRNLFDAGTPELPGFARAPGFVF